MKTIMINLLFFTLVILQKIFTCNYFIDLKIVFSYFVFLHKFCNSTANKGLQRGKINGTQIK